MTPEQETAVRRAGELIATGLQLSLRGFVPASREARQAAFEALAAAGLDRQDRDVIYAVCAAAAAPLNRELQADGADTVCAHPGTLPCVRACHDICPRWVNQRTAREE